MARVGQAADSSPSRPEPLPGMGRGRLRESSPALHLKKSRQARRWQRLEEGLELLRVKCNCEKMVSKYAIGQGERYSREVNKFSLRILTYHKKESKHSTRTYFYQAFAQTQTSLIRESPGETGLPFTKKHLEGGGGPGGDGVASRPPSLLFQRLGPSKAVTDQRE